VREIITRIATGEMTAYSMAWDLNQRGLLTVEGNAWDSSTLRRVVTNPLHSARAVERRYETKPPKRRRKTMDERKTKALKSKGAAPPDRRPVYRCTQLSTPPQPRVPAHAARAPSQRCTSKRSSGTTSGTSSTIPTVCSPTCGLPRRPT
jgi:hypothetical protein